MIKRDCGTWETDFSRRLEVSALVNHTHVHRIDDAKIESRLANSGTKVLVPRRLYLRLDRRSITDHFSQPALPRA
jgi:hypothetical protein